MDVVPALVIRLCQTRVLVRLVDDQVQRCAGEQAGGREQQVVWGQAAGALMFEQGVHDLSSAMRRVLRAEVVVDIVEVPPVLRPVAPGPPISSTD